MNGHLWSIWNNNGSNKYPHYHDYWKIYIYHGYSMHKLSQICYYYKSYCFFDSMALPAAPFLLLPCEPSITCQNVSSLLRWLSKLQLSCFTKSLVQTMSVCPFITTIFDLRNANTMTKLSWFPTIILCFFENTLYLHGIDLAGAFSSPRWAQPSPAPL
jgi:hypothetical protein